MTDSNLKCPACGFDRIESDKVCLMCGIDFQIYQSSKTKEPDKKQDIISDKKHEPLHEVKILSGSECPSCGFERMGKDRVCLMCGIDFQIYGSSSKKDTEKETVKNDVNAKSEFVNISAFDDSGDEADRLVMEFEETEKVIGFCPNCKLNRYFGDYECRGCGVVFSKVESLKYANENEMPGSPGKADYLKDFSGAIARTAVFFVLAGKNLFTVLGKFIPGFLTLIRSLTVTLSSAAWTFKKQIILFLAAVIGIFVFYYSINSAIDSYLVKSNEKKRIAAETALEKEAEQFRDNSWSLKEHIMLVADTDGIEPAMLELKKYDIPNLRYNPFFIMLKNSLDERALNQKILNMPYDNYEARYEAYASLFEIDPGNMSYADLLKLNRVMLASTMAEKADSILRDNHKDKVLLENAISIAEKAYGLEPSPGNEWLVFRAKSAKLLFYEGNENVVMALRDDGFSGQKNRNQRKIRVWLKNIGPDVFRINLDFFSLVCDDGIKYQYNDYSKNLVTELAPGAEVEGDVFFYTKSRPRRLVFDHVKLGKISREFP